MFDTQPPNDQPHWDRRSEPRFPSSGTAYVTDLNDHTLTIHLAAIVDVSSCGLQLELDVPLGVGVHIKIQFPSTILVGQVSHIRRHSPARYRVGVRTTVICGSKIKHWAVSSSLLALSQAVAERRREEETSTARKNQAED